MIGFFFPGQGSQKVGMGKAFYESFFSVRYKFEEASDILKIDFKKLCFEGPQDKLTLTENTQPALLLVSVAIGEICISHLKPHYSAGHSLGEYSALVNAGTLNFTDALLAVRQRGIAMQKAVPQGTGKMLAVIGLNKDEIYKLCQWAQDMSGEILEPANFNSSNQIVISGSCKAIDCLITATEPWKKRAKLIPLNVSAPFHCQLMKPAQETMRNVLNKITFLKPEWPIVQNVSAREESNPEKLKSNLISQVSSTVLWEQSVSRLVTLGVRSVIELGSGQILTGLAKKIDRENLKTFNIQEPKDLDSLEKENLFE